MSSSARARAALLLAAVTAVLAVLVGLHSPAADVVTAAPDQLVPLTSDQQVLGTSAALDRILEVRRDADGTLVVVLPADVDPLALAQEHPAPAHYPTGSTTALGVGALLLALAARWRGLLLPGGGVVGASAAVGLLLGGSPTVAVWWAAAAVAVLVVLVGGITSGLRSSRGRRPVHGPARSSPSRPAPGGG